MTRFKRILLLISIRLSRRLGNITLVSFSVILDLFSFTGLFGGRKGALL